MESDFGLSSIYPVQEDDNFDDEPDYSRYIVEQEEAEYEEDIIVHKNDNKGHGKQSKKTKRSAKASKSKNVPKPKKMKRQKYESPIESFYNVILSWDVDLITRDNPALLGLPALRSLPNQFISTYQYYQYNISVSLEEARSCIVNSIWRSAYGTLELSCRNGIEVSNKVLSMATFHQDRGFIEATRPGSIFILECIQHPHRRILAAVAQSGPAMKMNILDRNSLTLWMKSDWLRSDARLTYPGTRWTARLLDTVISHQRMVATCSEQPAPPFMDQLLGRRYKPSGHIKFDDSDDETEVVVDDTINITSCVGSDNQAEENSSISYNESGMLNRSQQQAYDSCIKILFDGSKGSIQLVHGPPGCGKTYFLISLLYGILKKDKTVMVCAPSNKAICVALEEYLSLDHYSMDIVASLVGVEDKIESCSTSYDSSSSLRLSSSCALFPDVSSSTSISYQPLPILPTTLTEATERIYRPKAAQDVLVYKYSSYIDNALVAMSRFLCRLKSLFEGQAHHTADLLILTILSFHSEHEHVMRRIQATAYNVGEFPAYLSRAGHDEAITSLCHVITDFYDESIDFDLTNYQPIIITSLARFEQIYHELHLIFNQATIVDIVAAHMIQNSRVIFSTLIGAGHSVMKRNLQMIDVLICDEAAQALESEVIVALCVEPTHMILIGDPMQLPATILSTEIRSSGLGMSMMERLLKNTETSVHLLSTQYRMHPEISFFPNRSFYNGRLENSTSVSNRVHPIHSLDHERSSYIQDLLHHYSIIDLSSQESFDQYKSICNHNEASFVARLIRHISSSHLSPSSLSMNSVCVITFYSAQVVCIKKELQKLGLGLIRVMTVDSFQGSECDIVILSFVRSNVNGNIGFVCDSKRLNVALTRAKHLLIGVGCVRTLTQSSRLKERDSVRDLLLDAKERNRIFCSSEVDKVIC